MCDTSTDYNHVKIFGSEKQVYREFVMKKTKFSLKRWVILTVLLNCIAFFFNLHTQDQRILFVVLILALTVLLVKVHFKVSKESLLVMSSLGVQITTTFMSGRRKSRWYSLSQITDIVINEAVTMHQVIFYLCILMKHTSEKHEVKVVPLFQHSWPRLCCHQRIVNSAWLLLHTNKKR